MSNTKLGVRHGEMGIYQDITFEENTKKVVGFRKPHRRFKT
jgi:hypothetical protein